MAYSCFLEQNTIASLFSFTLDWNLFIPSYSSVSITWFGGVCLACFAAAEHPCTLQMSKSGLQGEQTWECAVLEVHVNSCNASLLCVPWQKQGAVSGQLDLLLWGDQLSVLDVLAGFIKKAAASVYCCVPISSLYLQVLKLCLGCLCRNGLAGKLIRGSFRIWGIGGSLAV